MSLVGVGTRLRRLGTACWLCHAFSKSSIFFFSLSRAGGDLATEHGITLFGGSARIVNLDSQIAFLQDNDVDVDESTAPLWPVSSRIQF